MNGIGSRIIKYLRTIVYAKFVRRKILAAVVSFAVILSIVALFVVRGPATHIPAEIARAQKAVHFTLYYPEQLPDGFSLDRTSVSVGGNVVIYSCIYEKTKRVSISIQPRYSSFSTDQFKATSEFTTHIGRAFMVDLEDRTTAAVVGPASWVLINAPNTMAVDDMRTLIDGLRSARGEAS